MNSFNNIREDIKQKIIDLYFVKKIEGPGVIPNKLLHGTNDLEVEKIRNLFIDKLSNNKSEITINKIDNNGGYSAALKIKLDINSSEIQIPFYINVWLSCIEYWSCILYYTIESNRYTYHKYSELNLSIKNIADVLIEIVETNKFEILNNDILGIIVPNAKLESSDDEYPKIATVFNLLFSEFKY